MTFPSNLILPRDGSRQGMPWGVRAAITRLTQLTNFVPSLLALACVGGPAIAASAPSDAERTEYLLMVKGLIDDNQRLPARHAIDAFSKFGYADSALRLDALNFAYADNFRSQFKDLEGQFKQLQPKFADLKSQPNDIKLVLGSGMPADQILRYVNDTLRVMDPDQPPPQIAPTTERIAAMQRSLEQIMGIIKREFPIALDAVKKNKDNEDKLEKLDINKPAEAAQAEPLQRQAVALRVDALRPFYLGHIALREAATRGTKFGLDQAFIDSINAYLKSTIKLNQDLFATWDFEWGDYRPDLGLMLYVIMGEGVRQSVDGMAADSVEDSMLKLVDMPLDAVKDRNAREEIQVLQLRAFASLLRWCIELNTPKSIDRGIALWLEFKENTRSDRDLGDKAEKGAKKRTLNGADAQKAPVLGQIWILAARLYQAKGDAAAAGTLFTEVKMAKNPLGPSAQRWLMGGGDSITAAKDPWGDQPIAKDPGVAFQLAKMWLIQGQNANSKQARMSFMSAAVELRSAVLGLASSTYDDQFVECAPQVYHYYALALSKLGMRYQAALAASEGLRAIRARVTDKKNPWKAANGQWTKGPGEMVQNLAQDAMAYSSLIAKFADSKRLYNEVSLLVGEIDQSLVGEPQEWAPIRQKGDDDGDYKNAIEEARAHQKKHQGEEKVYFKAFDAITRWRLAEYERVAVKDKKAADEIIGEVTKSTDAVRAKIENDLKQPGLAPERVAMLKKALTTCATASVSMKTKDKRYAEVIKDVTQGFATSPPSDAELGAKMLRYMALAVHDSEMALIEAQKADKQPKDKELLAIWPSFQEAAKTFHKFAPRYANAEGTALATGNKALASAFNTVQWQANEYVRGNIHADQMASIVDEAKLNFADFLEPELGEKSPHAQIMAVATALWDRNEKVRAVRLFAIYKKAIDIDPEISAYRQDPAGVIDGYDQLMGQRSELKKLWEERGGIRDLLVDKKDLLERIIKDVPSDQLDEEPRDYGKALIKLDAFRKLCIDQSRNSPEVFKTIIAKVDQLQKLVQGLAYAIHIDSNLAQYYRENGQADQAIPLYRRLYKEYNPRNPTYAQGFVEGVLDVVRHPEKGQVITPDALKGAREVAIRARDGLDTPQTQPQWWAARIQVLELSVAMGGKEIKETVEVTLKNIAIAKATPADALVGPPTPGDDKRVHRPANVEAVQLAERFLALYQATPSLKPTYRVERLESAGKPLLVFVPADAPKFEARAMQDAAGEDITVVVEVGAPAAVLPAAPGAAPNDPPKTEK